MNILKTEAYRFLDDDPRFGANLILLGFGGSKAYGTSTPTSDTDIRGIATRREMDILLGEDFEAFTEVKTDTVIYSFDKILALLSECNPNCIEMLGLRPEDYLLMTPTGEELLKRKSMFLSKRCINTFAGYATQQLYRLRQKSLDALTETEFNDHISKVITGMTEHLEHSWHIPAGKIIVKNDNGLKITCKDLENIPAEDFYGILNEISNVIRAYHKRSVRNEKALAHAKIQKHAMHLLRLYMMAIDLLKKCEIITYRSAEHDLLMDIRNGKYMTEDGMMSQDFWTILKEYEVKFEEAKINTKLPDEPDYEAIRAFRAMVNKGIVAD